MHRIRVNSFNPSRIITLSTQKVLHEQRPLDCDLIHPRHTETPHDSIGELHRVWPTLIVAVDAETPWKVDVIRLIQRSSADAFENLTRPVAVASFVCMHVADEDGLHSISFFLVPATCRKWGEDFFYQTVITNIYKCKKKYSVEDKCLCRRFHLAANSSLLGTRSQHHSSLELPQQSRKIIHFPNVSVEKDGWSW